MRMISANSRVSRMGCVWSSADISGDGLRIKFIKEIAKGGFSEVLLCEDIDSKDRYAVKKIVATSKEEEHRIAEECKMHRMLADEPHVVQLLADIQVDSTHYLAFPFYAKGTVADDLMRRRKNGRDYLPQNTVVRVLTGLCSALSAIHARGVAHCDLKTANVLLADDETPLLTDFGSAMRVPVEIVDSRSRQKWLDTCAEHCSMPYRAPELFNCDIGSSLDHRLDLWSLGCCAYALCYFVSPFDLVYESGGSIALAVQSPERIPYPPDSPYDDRLVALIKGLLVVEPADRVELAAVRAELAGMSASS